MRVTLLAFAQARDELGFSEQSIELEESSHLEDLLTAACPGILERLPGTRVAINHRYVIGNPELNDGAEVALLPPVSGG